MTSGFFVFVNFGGRGLQVWGFTSELPLSPVELLFSMVSISHFACYFDLTSWLLLPLRGNWNPPTEMFSLGCWRIS